MGLEMPDPQQIHVGDENQSWDTIQAKDGTPSEELGPDFDPMNWPFNSPKAKKELCLRWPASVSLRAIMRRC